MIISVTDACLSRMTALASNGGNRMAFIGNKYRSFFDHARFPTSAQRRTSVIGRHILSPDISNACSLLMEANFSNSGDPLREKTVKIYPRDFFLMVT